MKEEMKNMQTASAPQSNAESLRGENPQSAPKLSKRTYAQALSWQKYKREFHHNFVKKVWWDGDYLALETYGGEIVHMGHDFEPNKPHEVRGASEWKERRVRCR